MASSVNKVILIGNLGRDPELKYTAAGRPVANFTLATSESWKDKNTGERKELTEWHRCSIFGQPAEFLNQYAGKGDTVYVEGSIHTRKWQDQQGQDRYTTEIKARVLQLLGGKPKEARQAKPQPEPAGDDFSDDVPF